MAMTFIASAVATNDATGTTLNASTTLDILAGDLIVAFGGLAISSGAVTIATVTGGTALTMTQGNYNYYSVFEYMGWKQFTASESSATFRLTTSSDAANRSITVLQFRPSSDCSVDIHAGFVPGNATGASMTTTAISMIGDDIMTVAYAMVGNAATFSNLQINGEDADGTVSAGTRVRAWYHQFSDPDTSVTATGTLAASDEYIIELFAFRAVKRGITQASIRVQSTTNDWLHIESAPTGGSLITMWGRVPPYTGGYPHQRGNATLLEAQGDDVAILGLICNGGANAANVGVQRYNNNVMVGSRTPRDGWAGDYCMIDKYDLRIPEEAMLGGWNFYAVQYILQASAVLIRQWSKAGRGAEILFVESNPSFADLRAFLVSQGWTSGDAALFTPDDLVRLIIGAYPGDSANYVWYDLTQIRVYAQSTQPSLAEIDAISLAYAPDTTAWADWKLEWSGGSAVLTDRSGNGRTLLLNGTGTLYQGVDFYTTDTGIQGAGNIPTAASVGAPTIVPIYQASDIVAMGDANINFYAYWTPLAGIQGAGNIATGASYGSPSLSVNIDSAGIASAVALGQPTISPIANIAGAGGIASAETTGQPSLSPSISNIGIASGEAIGQPTVSLQSASIVGAGGIASAEAIGSLVSSLQVESLGIGTLVAVGTPTFTTLIYSTGIASGEAMGQPSLRAVISAIGIATNEGIGQPALAPTISVTGIASGAGLGSPGLTVNISATGIESEEYVGLPTVGVVSGILGAGDIASEEAIGGHTLTLNIGSTGIASGEAVGSPSLRTTLSLIGIPSGQALGTPALSVNMQAAGISSASVLGTPSLSCLLSLIGIPSTEALGDPAISLNLVSIGIASLEEFGIPTVYIGNTALGTTFINGEWKKIQEYSICIEGDWKSVSDIRILVKGEWKNLMN